MQRFPLVVAVDEGNGSISIFLVNGECSEKRNAKNVLFAVVNCFRVYCDFHDFLCCVVLRCLLRPMPSPVERATGEAIKHRGQFVQSNGQLVTGSELGHRAMSHPCLVSVPRPVCA